MKPDNESLLLVVEMWRRRVEWLWRQCEETSGRPLDIEWLDEQITKEEDATHGPRKAS